MKLMTLAAVCAWMLAASIAPGQPHPNPLDQALRKIASISDTSAQREEFTKFVRSTPIPFITDSTVTFLYEGNASRAAVPSELNGWNPSSAPMERIEGTRIFVRTEALPSDARLEYKIWADSAWMLDPHNPNTAAGGYGSNSDAWMPKYKHDPLTLSGPLIHGQLDTMYVKGESLGQTHPVFLYLPPGEKPREPLPLLIVTDGQDYLTFTRLHLILDTLISSGTIKPILAVFVDPKTNLQDPSSNKRMTEYAADDKYLDYLENDVLPTVAKIHAISNERVILGASMGGLISTYAVLKRPSVFTGCMSQSPAYLQGESAVIKLLDTLHSVRGKFTIQTGTMRDTEVEARKVRSMIEKIGGDIRFEEFHEGHNWTNWKRHLPPLLLYFFHQ